ncbi:MAG TPA: hypothetical protein DD438_02325, partial [Verrucomicrobiales bacterium]|nr:hypothetical protein [Verrucomicrobiales bacterium]
MSKLRPGERQFFSGERVYDFARLTERVLEPILRSIMKKGTLIQLIAFALFCVGLSAQEEPAPAEPAPAEPAPAEP